MAIKEELNKLRSKKNRKIGKPIYDRQKLIEEMLEWSEDESSINFCAFCAEGGYLPSLIWRLQNEYQDFCDAYMICKMRLAERRERLLNAEAMHGSAFHLYQRSYDPFLDKHKNEQADLEAERKRKTVEQETVNLMMIAEQAAKGAIKQEENRE